jgi:hypothetical protein
MLLPANVLSWKCGLRHRAIWRGWRRTVRRMLRREVWREVWREVRRASRCKTIDPRTMSDSIGTQRLKHNPREKVVSSQLEK